VWGDADLIKQVVLNILVNAQQSIAGEGKIEIESRRVEKLNAKPGTESLRMVEFTISDTGCGIPEANLQRIFDPFFTSKEVGKGTGLGLSVSYGIVNAHGGKIKVDSIVGTGTTFRIRLPIQSPNNGADLNTEERTQ